MELKFYLNKFLRVSNIEDYTIGTLFILRERYEKFLEKSEGVDPDFPFVAFGDGSKTIKNPKSAIVDNPESDDENNNGKSLTYIDINDL